jgi:hypothetical protein
MKFSPKKKEKKKPAFYNNTWQQKQLSVKNWLLGFGCFRFFSPHSRNYHDQKPHCKEKKGKI